MYMYTAAAAIAILGIGFVPEKKFQEDCWSGWHGGGRRSEMRAWMCTAGEMR